MRARSPRFLRRVSLPPRLSSDHLRAALVAATSSATSVRSACEGPARSATPLTLTVRGKGLLDGKAPD